MEEFDGDELVTIGLSKYQYLLKCKRTVKKFHLFIRLLELDDDNPTKKLSEFDITEHRVNVLKRSGIITVRDLKNFVIDNYPSTAKLSSVCFRGLGPSGSISVLATVLGIDIRLLPHDER